MGQQADKLSSGGEVDYEDEEALDQLADDAHAKTNLPKETVDHDTTSHGTKSRVSIFRSKKRSTRLGFLGIKRAPATHS